MQCQGLHMNSTDNEEKEINNTNFHSAKYGEPMDFDFDWESDGRCQSNILEAKTEVLKVSPTEQNNVESEFVNRNIGSVEIMNLEYCCESNSFCQRKKRNNIFQPPQTREEHAVTDRHICYNHNKTENGNDSLLCTLERSGLSDSTSDCITNITTTHIATTEYKTSAGSEALEHNATKPHISSCRHPRNSKYNEHSTGNSSLIIPRKIVAYTPGGQQYEINLNQERPAWFSTENERIQYDYAVLMNANRMKTDIEKGQFIPSTLNKDLEEQFLRNMADTEEKLKNYFENQNKDIMTVSSYTQGDTENVFRQTEHLTEEYRYLSIEEKLLDFDACVKLKLADDVDECVKKVNNLMKMDLKPLMFKKNPQLIKTIKKISSLPGSSKISAAAKALYTRIKCQLKSSVASIQPQYTSVRVVLKC